jgi:CRISPR/Cas system-associated protein Csm6
MDRYLIRLCIFSKPVVENHISLYRFYKQLVDLFDRCAGNILLAKEEQDEVMSIESDSPGYETDNPAIDMDLEPRWFVNREFGDGGYQEW